MSVPAPTNEQAVFRALADPTRRTIIGLLADRSLTVTQVASHFDMSRPAVAKHLGILQDGDIICVKAQGRERVNSLQPMALKSVSDWLSHYNHFWDEKLSNLKSAIETQKEQGETP
ncbi:MAG: transcriptional regulator [Robiginitomaculum sp.]|nr:MAG: transcriptional regulator [Robiginitomaculum sp.]